MKIAYFILVHQKRHLFERLIRAIHDPRNIYLIHVDTKADDEIFRTANEMSARFPNIKLLPSRFLGWGAWSLVQVELDAIRYLLNQDAEWTHFINLSGQDMPLVSQNKIRETLASYSPESNFVHLEKMSDHDQRNSLGQFYIEDFGGLKIMGERNPFESYFAEGIEPYRGAQWKIITRSFAEFAVTSPIAFDMQDYFRYTLIPDELYFPTLIMNCEYAKTRVTRNYRYIIFERRESGFAGPITLTMSNLDGLLQSDDFFARKFDDEIDSEVIDVIEKNLWGVR